MNAPAMVPGTVEMVSVEWIMQNATSSVDDVLDEAGKVDYLKMGQRKGSDYQFPFLVSTIMERGFRVPIVLCLDYNYPGDVVHGNGHHRMIAALLLALDHIPVFWSGSDEYGSDYMCVEKSETEPMDYHSNVVDGLWSDAPYTGPWGKFEYNW